MTNSRNLLLAALLAVASAAYAVPAKPVRKTVQLSDGTSVELTLRGDEHFSFYTADDGTPFALLDGGRLERLTREQVAETWAARRAERLRPAAGRTAWGASPGMRRSSATTGKHRGLVILMEFPDQRFVTADPRGLFTRFFNEPGFSEDGMAGSVKDYFLKQSYGQLEVDFDVVGPFTTGRNMAYYGGNNAAGVDANAAYMALEAVDAASAVVDYGDYDWNGDGEVDQVFIVYAGYAESQGADPRTIWPHEWKLQYGTGTTRTYNGKVINTYGCASELAGDGRFGVAALDGIGSACHEYSHCLGLPDTYDTGAGTNYAMSYWDVMSAGNYNDNSRTPAGFTSYERMLAGWLKPVEISSLTQVTGMKPLATDSVAYIIYNDGNRNEYYLLENRQPVDFDRGLPGHGLLILHVDYNESVWRNNTINTVASRQRMTVIPADNNYTASTAGMRGDTWPGTSGNTALTNYSVPAATLYNENVDGTKLMSKPIEDIAEDAAAMTVSFVACRPELGIPVPDGGTEVPGLAAFTVTWPAVSEAIAYQVEVTEIGMAASDPAEQLGIQGAAAASAPRRAAEAKVYTTETNSCTLEGLDLRSRYVYRVRAVGEGGRYSRWSEERTFAFSGAAVTAPTADGNAPARCYDMQGREVGSGAKGLIIVKQGNEVRKVMK